MSYGVLSAVQRKALEPFVRGQTVYDLGAGDLGVAHDLIDLGASQVVAVDVQVGRARSPRIASVQLSFRQAALSTHEGRPIGEGIVLLSWPPNHHEPYLEILSARATRLIYLGKNTDGMACGSQRLFSDLSEREVLLYVPERPNSLIVYGDKKVTREFLGEEIAVLTSSEKMWSFSELSQVEIWEGKP